MWIRLEMSPWHPVSCVSSLLCSCLCSCASVGIDGHVTSFVMARHRASYEHPGDDEMNEIIGNGSLSEHYLALARDLDVTEAKVGTVDTRSVGTAGTRLVAPLSSPFCPRLLSSPMGNGVCRWGSIPLLSLLCKTDSRGHLQEPSRGVRRDLPSPGWWWAAGGFCAGQPGVNFRERLRERGLWAGPGT